MANPLKQLAGETAIYGLSTILARVINFALVPLYTRVLTQMQYGVVSEFMAYIAMLQVVLTLGLETGCFRYASKEGADPRKVFSNAFVTVFGVCALFLACLIVFSGSISTAMGYPGFRNLIIYCGLILLIDCTTAILFAKLRHEHKALRFAVIKTVKILTELGVNLLLYLVMAARFAQNPSHWLTRLVSAVPDFTYPIFAILVSCIVCLLLISPELLKLTFRLDGKLIRRLLVYSLPLMVAGLPGIMNDVLDRLLMRFINADPVNWRADLGVYQAAVKLAVIMQLFVQMFRYAAEPFFFQRERDKGSKKIYADVLNYFTAFCMFGFVVLMLFMDEIGLILGKDFRAGLAITPVMLMAYVVTGILFNVNIWYKLSEKTGYAVWITLAGLVVTVVVNLLFMPLYSYRAAAWGHVASYLTMLLLTAVLGRKHYPIPYNWGLVFLLVAAGLGIWGLSLLLPEMGTWAEIFVHLAFVLLYIAVAFVIFVIHKRRTAR
ncbi:MAG: oligosaccharide flippase family protein [Bacteroidales bacterium]|nr:oligosaccharide flippase family protein [Bacteroidales bacterium]